MKIEPADTVPDNPPKNKFHPNWGAKSFNPSNVGDVKPPKNKGEKSTPDAPCK